MKVWDGAGIELRTPRSAVRLESVGRHVTGCATWPGSSTYVENVSFSPQAVIGYSMGVHPEYLFSYIVGMNLSVPCSHIGCCIILLMFCETTPIPYSVSHLSHTYIGSLPYVG